MKKPLAILSLFVFLSANTAFGQLLRLPALIQHYAMHKEEDDPDGLLAFLAEHYLEAVSHHNKVDHSQQHQGLPFKNAASVALHSVITTDEIFTVTLDLPVCFVPCKTGMEIQTHYLSAISGNIWQPPRNC